jgi:hypothetical protein
MLHLLILILFLKQLLADKVATQDKDKVEGAITVVQVAVMGVMLFTQVEVAVLVVTLVEVVVEVIIVVAVVMLAMDLVEAEAVVHPQVGMALEVEAVE